MLQLQTLISSEAVNIFVSSAVGLVVVPASVLEHDHQNSQSSVVPSILGTVYFSLPISQLVACHSLG